MHPKQKAALEEFDTLHIGASKGALSAVVTVTRNLKDKTFPVNPNDLKTGKEGQVAGLGGGAIKKILKDHGIVRTLSSEGGRTSRGNMGKIQAYVALLNELAKDGVLDLDAVEKFWIERINVYLDSKPFTLKLDPSKSLRFCIRELLKQAIDRQREVSGTTYAGTVMQHLVGAKIDLILEGIQEIKHYGANVADAPSDRVGDFFIGDTAIHVTIAPSQALLEKAKSNLESGKRPVIVTTENGAGGAKAYANSLNIEDRIDIIEIEQFLATNLYEWSEFNQNSRPQNVSDLVERYNQIVTTCETDPSLRIEYEP